MKINIIYYFTTILLHAYRKDNKTYVQGAGGGEGAAVVMQWNSVDYPDTVADSIVDTVVAEQPAVRVCLPCSYSCCLIYLCLLRDFTATAIRV